MQSGQGEARRGDRRAYVGLGVIGRVTRDDDDSLADLQAPNAAAQLKHLADGIAAEDMGEGKLGRDRALSDVMVEAVDAGGEDLDDHVTGLQFRGWNVFEPQHVDISKFMNNGGFHHSTPLNPGLHGRLVSIERPRSIVDVPHIG